MNDIPSTSREAFLTRVREAARAGRAHRVHTEPIDPSRGYVGAEGDLREALAREIRAVGGEATLVPDLAAARIKLAELLATHAVRSAVCWRHPLLEQLDLAGLLAERGAEPLDFDSLAARPAEERRPPLLAAEMGITSCDWAVAESGTLVLCAAPGRERLASLLPPVHVAVVAAGQIVPDLFDVFAALESRKHEMPTNLVLITGPSKTGDIELQLTTGVHGPGVWHVLVVGDA